MEPVVPRVNGKARLEERLDSRLPFALLADVADQAKFNVVLEQVRATDRHAALRRQEKVAPLVQRHRLANLLDVNQVLCEVVLLLLCHVCNRVAQRSKATRVVRLLEEDVRGRTTHLVLVRGGNEERLLARQADRHRVDVVIGREDAVLAVDALPRHLRARGALVGLKFVQHNSAVEDALAQDVRHEEAHIVLGPSDFALVHRANHRLGVQFRKRLKSKGVGGDLILKKRLPVANGGHLGGKERKEGRKTKSLNALCGNFNVCLLLHHTCLRNARQLFNFFRKATLTGRPICLDVIALT